jgi:TPR repeat protein
MYESGLGVTQDYVVAVRWFRLGALHKNVHAETNLGIMHANGRGVTQNLGEARKWFQLAADHGEVKAQRNLGALYATGRGVPQSYPEAAKWYGLAAKRGDAVAGSVLEKIRSAQAREAAQSQRPEERNVRAQIPSAPRQPFAHIEPTVFRLSSPAMEQRTVRIGPPPSVGFHMMSAHFGRRR